MINCENVTPPSSQLPPPHSFLWGVNQCYAFLTCSFKDLCMQVLALWLFTWTVVFMLFSCMMLDPRTQQTDPQAKSARQAVFFANKVFLEHRHAHSFPHCLWLHLHTIRVEELLQRPCGLLNLKYLLSGPFQKKSPTPVSTNRYSRIHVNLCPADECLGGS